MKKEVEVYSEIKKMDYLVAVLKFLKVNHQYLIKLMMNLNPLYLIKQKNQMIKFKNKEKKYLVQILKVFLESRIKLIQHLSLIIIKNHQNKKNKKVYLVIN